MSRQPRHGTEPHGLRVHVLLVLAVLAGVVAMHGLGPVTFSASTGTASVAPHRAAVTAEIPAHADTSAECDCSHVDDHGREGGGHAEHADDHGREGGGHAEHADEICAASGTGAPPALPAPAPSGVLAPPATGTPRAVLAGTPDGRAPPSLSELQLLRI
ncbi:DUF6153 family protein [Streptomyces peucetius]|uniref:DUF6153 family protein n=1 Tax=Streptomyces peucetius TaxID=1950 RepID=A0ABY6I2W9_STRPE|nr:DUF6153 family protein [Streptomyces peucetius]UYQ60630.1 DUF6153 family protein [Streptomyces peucetius]